MSRSFETLGLTPTASADEVKARWRELRGIHHPDRGGDPAEFDRLRRAYDDAIEEASRPKLCVMCDGQGRIKQTYGWSSIEMHCPACRGTGVEQ